MRDRLNQWLSERPGSGSDMTADEMLWGALLVGLLFASVHLLTMMVTRWGDQRATSKSLIFSILVHVSCAAGLVALNPPRIADGAPDGSRKKLAQDTLKLKAVEIKGTETFDTREEGNTPVWKRVSETVKAETSRHNRLPLDAKPFQLPQRRALTPAPPDIDEPQLASLPREDVVMPEPQRMGDPGRLEPAKIPLKVEDETAERRPELTNPTPLKNRLRNPRMHQVDRQVSREPTRGAVERIEREVDPSRKLAMVDDKVDPQALLKQGELDRAIRMRQGPAPSTDPLPFEGATAAQQTQGSTGGSAATRRITRIRTRPVITRPEGGVERFRPQRVPQTPRPDANRMAAVRHTLPTRIPREGPAPNVVRPDFRPIQSRKKIDLPETYQLRSLAKRRETARKFGGTDASELAVENGLRWLALHQHPSGYWDADLYSSGKVRIDEQGIDRMRAGEHADTGVTGLAVLAFLGAGYTHMDGKYADVVDRALRWLIRRQRSDGFLGGNAGHYARTYCHAMAAYALAEAEVFRLNHDPTLRSEFREPLRKAIAYTLRTQNGDDGGWRYRPYFKGQKSDMSIFGWQLMGLKSAENAGIAIRDDAKRAMVQFLKDRSRGDDKGLAGYRPDTPPTASMTAEALFCKQIFRIPRSHPSSTEAVEYLRKQLPSREEYNVYYWYYGTLALYQHQGRGWQEWNRRIRDLLVADQETRGTNAGSWSPRGAWGRYGGRVYSTALSTLCLEVYYRYSSLNRVDPAK